MESRATVFWLSVVVLTAGFRQCAAATELLQGAGSCTAGASITPPWATVSGQAWECCDDCVDGTTVIYPGGCSGPECLTRNNPLVQEIKQVVNVSSLAASIDAGAQAFALSGSMSTYCGIDATVLAMSFLDGDGHVLASHETCRYQDTAWGSAVMVEDAPTSTRFVAVRLIGEARGGNDADAFFDKLSLKACDPNTVGDCPVSQQLLCPRMTTSIIIGPRLDELLTTCSALFTLTSLQGIEFPTAIRTGYCTVQCAEVIDEIESLYSGSKDPTCDEFPVINAVLQRETSFARRKCKTPVSNDYAPRSAGAPRHAGIGFAVALAAVLATTSLTAVART